MNRKSAGSVKRSYIANADRSQDSLAGLSIILVCLAVLYERQIPPEKEQAL